MPAVEGTTNEDEQGVIGDSAAQIEPHDAGKEMRIEDVKVKILMHRSIKLWRERERERERERGPTW